MALKFSETFILQITNHTFDDFLLTFGMFELQMANHFMSVVELLVAAATRVVDRLDYLISLVDIAVALQMHQKVI